jgi:hypothetical protein
MPDKMIAEYARKSQFVAAGVLGSIGATTMPIEPAVSNAGIFKVEEVLHGPKELRGFNGREITVLFNDPASVRAGESSVLFATSWQYGQSLAVLEVGRMDDKERVTMRKEIDAAYEALADERLAQRIALAQLVIVGKVTKTNPTPEDIRKRMPISEHAPDWWEAVIARKSVEKGRHEGATITILFPNSVDVAWSQSPKFKPGQEGVWILQRDQQERGWPIMRVPGFTALDALDFQPPSQIAHIRSLIKRP